MTSRHASPTLSGTGDYPELTSVRALASLAVVGTHAAFWTGHYRGAGALVWARLDFGVALFFALSGFLLFRRWVAALALDQPPGSTASYFRKRAVRILPGYWITVVVAFAFVSSDSGRGVAAFARSLVLTQVYGGDLQHRGLTQMWSLCVEVAFYLLLPVLAWLGIRVCCRNEWRPGRLLLFVAAFGAITPVWYVLTREVWVLDISSVFWPPGYLDWFAVGMGLAVLAVRREYGAEPSAALRAVAAAPGACWVVAGALLVIAATPAAGDATLVPLPLFDALTKNLLYAVAAGLMLAPIVLGASGSASLGWLRWRPLTWLGDISYEVFLVHLVVIEAVLVILDYPVFTGSVAYVFVLTTAASIGLAWLLRRFVDRLLVWCRLDPPSHHDGQQHDRRHARPLNRPVQS